MLLSLRLPPAKSSCSSRRLILKPARRRSPATSAKSSSAQAEPPRRPPHWLPHRGPRGSSARALPLRVGSSPARRLRRAARRGRAAAGRWRVDAARLDEALFPVEAVNEDFRRAIYEAGNPATLELSIASPPGAAFAGFARSGLCAPRSGPGDRRNCAVNEKRLIVELVRRRHRDQARGQTPTRPPGENAMSPGAVSPAFTAAGKLASGCCFRQAQERAAARARVARSGRQSPTRILKTDADAHLESRRSCWLLIVIVSPWWRGA